MSELQFICAVKEHRILYSNVNNANNDKQHKIWEKLAKDFQLKNGLTAQKKWQKLLEKYLFYLRCGDNGSFPYAKTMQFIQPYLIRERESTSDPEMDENELESILYSDDEPEFTNNDLQTSSNEPASTTSNMDEKMIEIKEEDLPVSTEIIQSNHNTYVTESSTGRMISSTATTLNSFSSLELIFLGYARQLQKMPLALQLRTKRKIADVMNEAEMETLKNEV